MKALLNAGVDPNPGLIVAISHHRIRIVRLLLAKGATPGPQHAETIRSLP